MNEHLTLIGYDSETHRIAAGNVAPRMVCGQASSRFGVPGGPIQNKLAARADGTQMIELIEMILSGQFKITCHNAAFDLAVAAANFPYLMSRIYDILGQGLVSDTAIREKLLNLTETGDLKYMTLPTGAKAMIEYRLINLEKFYLGRDRTPDKTLNDAWRLNYSVLEPLPSSQWPMDAQKYALEDSIGALEVHECQEVWRQDLIARIGVDPFQTEAFQVFVDFNLFLTSCWGIATDEVEVLRVLTMLEQELSTDKVGLLVKSGILRPGSPSRPNAKGVKDHVQGCKKKWVHEGRTHECSCPVKMTNAVKPSINEGIRDGYIKDLASRDSRIKLKFTAPTEKFPEGSLSVDAEFLDAYAAFDPILGQLQHRQELMKLVSTEMPRLMVKDEKGEPIPGHVSPIIHPRYDVLKETGRTSAYGDKAVPSSAIQQIDPRARGCYVPRPGFLMFSVDLSFMELGTFGQVCLDLFGWSKMAEVINAGLDPHTWLGAQIAMASEPWFRDWCQQQHVTDSFAVQKLFDTLKGSPHEAHQALFKKYRKLAKPTGLGYPGGLGPDTFIAYAKGTFDVTVDLETATHLRNVWREAVAEAKLYFDYINKQCIDPFNEPRQSRDPETGEPKTQRLYRYQSPMGMYRAGCVYCAAANGIGLQTPSSEGAKLGFANVVRACYDPAMCSILGDDAQGPTTRPLAFIHDETLGEVRDDANAHDRVMEVGRIMVEAMSRITPKVKPRFGAALMRRWNKDAEAVYDANGRLTVWEPKKKEGTTP